MFTKIIQIAWKDTLLQFSSRSQWLFFLVLPIVFTVVLGGRFVSSDDDAPTGLLLPVVDGDQSALSQAVIDELVASDGVRPEVLSADAAQERFDENGVAAMLTIPAGFESAVQGGDSAEIDLLLQPNNTNGAILQQAVATAVRRVAEPIAVANGSQQIAAELTGFTDTDEQTAFFNTALDTAREEIAARPQRIVHEKAVASELNSRLTADFLLAQQSIGQLITWVFIPLVGTAVFLTSERTRGTLRRLLTTPTRKATYLLGTVAGALGVGLVQMLLLVVFGAVVFDIRYARDPLALAIVLVTFGLAAVALGTLLGTMAKTDSQANNLSIICGMLFALLGGLWFPLENFPPAATRLSQVFPTRWAMDGLLDLAVRGQTVSGILLEAGVLLAFAAVFFTIAIWRFRYE